MTKFSTENDATAAALKAQYSRIDDMFGCLGVLQLHVQSQCILFSQTTTVLLFQITPCRTYVV